MLPPGVYQLALSRGSGAAVRAQPPLRFAGAMRVHGEYQSHSGRRIAGGIVLGVGLANAASFAIAAAIYASDSFISGSSIVAIYGVLAAIVGVIALAIRIPLLSAGDGAVVF